MGAITAVSVFNDLVATITDLRGAQDRVVVAISGFGGSGKSTLAERIRRQFANDCAVVPGDLLYSTTPRSEDLLGMTDWVRFTQIATSARTDDRLRYRGRTYDGDEFDIDEPMPHLVVFEGIRLLRPELVPLYDIAVWVDCPQDIATARAKQRNLLQGDSDEEMQLWDTLWNPLDAKYFAEYQPLRLATLIYPYEG